MAKLKLNKSPVLYETRAIAYPLFLIYNIPL